MKTFNLVVKEKKALSWKLWMVMFGLMAMIATSCNQEAVNADTTQEDQASVDMENQDNSHMEDVDDMTSSLLEIETSNSGGKVGNPTDARLACAQITRTGTEESGTIVIDFGDGCPGPRGNIRKGKIIVDYSGRWAIPGSFWSVEFEDFFVNDISIAGTRIVNNISETAGDTLIFSVVMEDGLMTWPDGSKATRKVHHRREVVRTENHLLDRLIVYGTAEGNHRNGRGYFIEIVEPLIYTHECKQQGITIPVMGVKSIKHGERQITVDYGNGTCDNTVIITNKNGKSWRHEVGS